MNELLINQTPSGTVLDSREVAEMVEKRHSDLLETIQGYARHLTNGNFRSLDFFIPDTYLDTKGETRPCCQVTKKGCEMIANKMTGQKGILFTAAYVTKFNQMEMEMESSTTPQYRIPQTFSEALRLAADLEEQKLLLESKIEQDKPKVESYESLMSADGLLSMAKISKILDYKNVGPRKIFHLLHTEGFFYKSGKDYLAKQIYINDGYFKHKTTTILIHGEPRFYSQIFATTKGLSMLDKHLTRNGFCKNRSGNG